MAHIDPSSSAASASSGAASAPLARARPAPILTGPFLRLLAAQLTIGFGFATYFLLPKYLVTSLSAPPSVVGMVGASGLAAGVAASPWIGTALDRWDRRRPMLFGAALVLLASLAMVTVHRVGPLLYALRVIQGLGFALGFNSAAVMAADLAPAERLGQAFGLLGVASLITNAVAPALGESLAELWGWPAVFLMAALTALFTLALAYTLPAGGRSHAVPAPSADPSPRGVLCAAMVTGAAFATLITFTQPFALELGARRVAGYLVGYSVGAVIVRVGFGGSVDRFGRRRVAQLGLVGYGLVTISTAALHPRWLELFGFGFGLAHGFVYPALAALVAEGASIARRGRTLTNFNAAFNAGAGLSMISCGWLAHAAGYGVVFISVGTLTLLSASMLRWPRRTFPNLVVAPETKP